MKPSCWGEDGWIFYFSLCRGLGTRLSSTDNRSIVTRPLLEFGSLLPCSFCRRSFGWFFFEHVEAETYPVPFRSIQDLYLLWLETHNFVNRKLAKKVELNGEKFIDRMIRNYDSLAFARSFWFFVFCVVWNETEYGLFSLKTCLISRLCGLFDRCFGRFSRISSFLMREIVHEKELTVEQLFSTVCLPWFSAFSLHRPWPDYAALTKELKKCQS